MCNHETIIFEEERANDITYHLGQIFRATKTSKVVKKARKGLWSRREIIGVYFFENDIYRTSILRVKNSFREIINDKVIKWMENKIDQI